MWCGDEEIVEDAALAARGYIGADTRAPPDVKTLEEVLQGFEGLGSTTFAGAFGAPAASSGQEVDSWAHALPPDFKRAGVEIYRNIRTSGSTSTRHWLERQFQGYRGGEQWQSLWATASTLDFGLGRCKTGAGQMVVLSTNEVVEIGQRHLSAFA